MLVGLSRWSSTGLTPFLGRPGQCGFFYATPVGELLTNVSFNGNQAYKNGGSSLESGFEPGALQLRSRDLTTRPPWSSLYCRILP
ncbi:hypothetical protein AVEN_263153-1 [Araneus ventricosus]|uniref:Uncharacterized protein n=1 Tax=Araneus ventricosus TaxID=182803 RepID=A0A4Y2F8C2_ARAVE|nr:hypothetical protein AVEN_263153-1 [Araneus ventricosus]